MERYRDVEAWQRGMELAEAVYALSQGFPPAEREGLTGQLRRAVVAVPASIAEGTGRLHRAEYVRCAALARGALRQVETHLQLAVRLGFCSREAGREAWRLAQATGQALDALIARLHAGTARGIAEARPPFGFSDADPLIRSRCGARRGAAHGPRAGRDHARRARRPVRPPPAVNPRAASRPSYVIHP